MLHAIKIANSITSCKCLTDKKERFGAKKFKENCFGLAWSFF